MNTQDKLKLAKEVGLSVPHYTNTDNPVDFPKSSNKRIQELWENSDAIHTVYPRQGSPIYASSELLEKFAELIVQECMNTVRQAWYDENAKSTEGMDSRSIGIHVGVKSGLTTALNLIGKLK